MCVEPTSHRLLVVRNFQKLNVNKLDELLTCDDIWNDVLSKFDDPSDCLECFNLIMNELLDLLIPRKTLKEFVTRIVLGYPVPPLSKFVDYVMLLIVKP